MERFILRIDAINIHASDEVTDSSQSLARRRHRPSHAKVLSTTQRFGKTINPLAQSERLTILSVSPLM
jgi:hypothetical protein